MQSYSGTCHCHAVTFTFEADEIKSAMRCNCSICKRKGTILSDFTLAPDEIDISADTNVLNSYQFLSNTAQHHFCTICGIHTFVEIRLIPGKYRVNLGCIDAVDTFALSITDFDGAAL